MTIYEQIKNYCECVNAKDRDIDELINLISVYTCWTQKPCETFILGERREVKELPSCVSDCDIYEFEPFYAPFDPQSFTFTLVEQNGLIEAQTPITDYVYSEADEKFRIELPLPDCKCKPKCGCESKYKLIATYVAGYEEIPECLLPVMCDALEWIADKNDCDCTECAPCDTNKYSDAREINYATLSGRLQEHFLTVLSVQYFRQLSLISLCQKRHNLWSVVV